MKIHCYFICWNDSFYIPFFHAHYSKFCEKIIMYDQFSSDGSPAIARSLGIEVRTFGNTELNDQVYLDVKNHCWKECRGKAIDYVIVCDVDEFIVLPPTLTASLPKVQGYNMISEKLPINTVFEISTGSESESYSKRAIFSPDRITEINYRHGCHVCAPEGEITENDNCKLYHYRQIGGVQRTIDRHAVYRQRMSGFNRKYGMGIHYQHSDEAKREEWRVLSEGARELW